jgi:hypothetical protein
MSGRAPLTSAQAVQLWTLALISLNRVRAASTAVLCAFLTAGPAASLVLRSQPCGQRSDRILELSGLRK